MKVSKTLMGQLVVSFAIIRNCFGATKLLKFRRFSAPSRRLLNPVTIVNDVSLLECGVLCTDTSVCTAVNYHTETRRCELVGATWKEDFWDENDGWKVYRNVNVCDFIEYPGTLIPGHDGGDDRHTQVNNCKTNCLEKNDDCLSFDYQHHFCAYNILSVVEAIEAGATQNNLGWTLYTKNCES